MRVLVAGLPDQEVHYLQQRLAAARFEAVPGPSVWDCLVQTRYDLLVLGSSDMGAQSLEALAEIRGRWDPARLPVVLVLPEEVIGREDVLRRAVELQADQILLPPYDPEDLVQQAAFMLGHSPAPSAAGAVGEAEWAMEKPSLTPHLDILERVARGYDGGGASRLQIRSGIYEGQKLHGALTRLGHEPGAELVAWLVAVFEGQQAPTEPTVATVERLRAVVDRPPGAAESPAESVEPTPAQAPVPTGVRLLIVDSDEETVEALAREASARGLEVAAQPDLSQPPEARPDVAILDIGVAESWEQLTGYLDVLDAFKPRVRLIVVSADVTQEARLAAARLDADAFVQKPVSPSALLLVVDQELGQAEVERPRVLVVDDDAVALSALESIFAGTDYDLVTLDDPSAFWEMLEQIQPDLLLLDLDIPEISGIELCRMVRSDPTWNTLPILFLTAVEDPEALEQVFHAGADDLALKPIGADELLLRVRNRLQRTRAVRRSGDVDALTGLAGRRRSLARFENFFRVASVDSPVSLAVLNVDLFQDVNACTDHDTGDAVLRRLGRILRQGLPANTVVSRWGSDEFVLGFYGLARDDAAARLNTVLDEVQRQPFGLLAGQPMHFSFSAGVAEHGRDGTTVIDLYRMAAMAMAEVKRGGRHRVRSCSWFEDPAFARQPMDVLVVHPDEEFASQVLIALGVHGFHGQWLSGGQSLLTTLLAAASARPGLVVLMDVDMPSVDGWALMRVFSSDATLSTARVVLLTSQRTPSVEEEASRLGAYALLARDVPFNVLMQRVRRALDS